MMLIRDVAQLAELGVGSGAGGGRGSGESGFDEDGAFPALDAFDTGFDFTVSHSLTPPGLGLYEYTPPRCSPGGCSTTLALIAMIDGTAFLTSGPVGG